MAALQNRFKGLVKIAKQQLIGDNLLDAYAFICIVHNCVEALEDEIFPDKKLDTQKIKPYSLNLKRFNSFLKN